MKATNRGTGRSLILALLWAACLNGALFSAPAAPAEKGSRSAVTLAAAPLDDAALLAELLKRVMPSESCNGGTCQIPSGQILSCPTSGGSACGGSTICSCQCYVSLFTYTWVSGNICMIIE